MSLTEQNNCSINDKQLDPTDSRTTDNEERERKISAEKAKAEKNRLEKLISMVEWKIEAARKAKEKKEQIEGGDAGSN